jgi:hypothetical protein
VLFLGTLYVVLLWLDTRAGRPRPSSSQTSNSSPVCRLRLAGFPDCRSRVVLLSRGAAPAMILGLASAAGPPPVSPPAQLPWTVVGAAQVLRFCLGVLPSHFFSISQGWLLLRTGARLACQYGVLYLFSFFSCFLPWGGVVCGEGQIEAMPGLSREEQK